MTDTPEPITEPATAPRPTRRGRHFGPRPVADPRSARLDIRCTPAVRAKAEAAAKGAGLSVAAYVAALIDGSPGPRAHRNPSELVKAVVQLAAQMGWRGSNLNQIAYRFNIEDIPAPAELADAIVEHRETCAEIRRILRMLSPDADHD